MGNFSWRVNGVPATGTRALSDADIESNADDYKDNYLQKVAKVVPVEVIGAYALAAQLLQGAPADQHVGLGIIVFVAGAVGTLLALVQGRGLGRVKPDPSTGSLRRDRAELVQIALAFGAFVVWAYAQGGVFATGPIRSIWFIDTQLWPYSSAVATLVVIGYALVIGWFDPKVKRDPAPGGGTPPPPIPPPANPVIPPANG